MIIRVYIEKKENGVVVIGEDDNPEVDDVEIVLESEAPDFEKRIGKASLILLKKPRKSPVKKGETHDG